MELCRRGEVDPERIDDWVGRWHEDDIDLPLYEYLGMTHEEYADWVSLRRSVQQILDDRRNMRPRRVSWFTRFIGWLLERLLGMPG